MLTQRITKTLVAPSVSLFGGGQPIDLTSLAAFKQEIGLVTTTDDAWISAKITSLSQAAEDYCSRLFIPALYQDQIWPAKDAYPWQLPPRIAPLPLEQFPILGPASTAFTPPPGAPTLSYGGGGSLAAATYYVRISYVTNTGETGLSLERFIEVPANCLLNVANPGADLYNKAIGYNVYVGVASFAETLQTVTPINVNVNWTLPGSGLISGAAMPQYVTVVENSPISPCPLAEGEDYLVDRTTGLLTRLFQTDKQPKSWGLPIIVIYWAGFTTIPDDLQDAVILMMKGRWYGRTRDPNIKSQNVEGVYSASYYFATGPGGQGDMGVDANAKLDRYKVGIAG